MSNIIFYIIPLIFVTIVIVSIIVIKKSNKKNEADPSILDINVEGVSKDSDFSYGYEKEETIVMNPVDENINQNEINEKEEQEENKEEFPDINEESEK